MLLKEGDIIELKDGHTVYATIAEHFVFSNKIGSFEPTKADVEIGKSKNGLDTNFLKGKYVVTKTVVHGGGTAHGPNDRYPDGHHIFCESVGGKFDKPVKVDFYQTGCFTAMIRENEIESIGRAEAEWKIKDEE